MSDRAQMAVPTIEPSAPGTSGDGLHDEPELVRVAWAITRRGALSELSEPEADLVRMLDRPGVESASEDLIDMIRSGCDPLGEALMRLRPPEVRRPLGAIYTPSEIVSSMVAWLARRSRPTRVIDPGTGSARFLLAAGRMLPDSRLVGVEIDPLAALLARANLTAAGLDRRSRILVQDYRTAELGTCAGITAYVGNPPYVRHHHIEPAWKEWLARSAANLGLRASGLAGMHVHFMLATALHAQPGDIGTFVTSAEWLDVNYGKLPRDLLTTELGGLSIHVVAPEATPFEDAATTAAVTCFEMGSTTPSIRLRRVKRARDLGELDGGRPFDRQQMAKAPRWSSLISGSRKPPTGYVELGELCTVHRGAVTGANATWITDASNPRLPASVLFPSITRAKELFEARDGVLRSTLGLRAVVDLPADLDILDGDERLAVDEFLDAAVRRGVHLGYIARHRNPWWSVGLRAPAPILATYMARRPPAFVRNLAAAHNVNVVHGIYPREPMLEVVLDALAAALNAAAPSAVGRTYAGGLLKFEPSEMARIPIPGPEMLR